MKKFIHEVTADGRVAILARAFCGVLKLDKIEMWYDSTIKSYIIEYIAADDFNPNPLFLYINGTIETLRKYDEIRTARTQG